MATTDLGALCLADALPSQDPPGPKRRSARHGSWTSVLLAADGEWRTIEEIAARAGFPAQAVRTPVNTMAWLGCLTADTDLRPARFRLANALSLGVAEIAVAALSRNERVAGRHYSDFSPYAHSIHLLVATVPCNGAAEKFARVFLCGRVSLPERDADQADPKDCPECVAGMSRHAASAA